MGELTASKFSSAALGLPGRFIMRDLFLMPAAALDKIERSVYFIVSILMASGMPGTIFSHTATVASGVTSLGAKPVPPVVTMSAISFEDALISSSDIFSF